MGPGTDPAQTCCKSALRSSAPARCQHPRRAPTPCCLITLTLAACMAAMLTSVQPAITKAMLPSDINEWIYEPTTTHKDYMPLKRLWDRSTLLHANAVAPYEQMHNMLVKLHAGQPVTVVAFGDSISAGAGGCFHRDLEHRKRHVTFHLRPGQQECEWQPYLPWLTGFMRMINRTWPHPDHLLVNLAVPATSLWTAAQGECLELYVPRQVDLLIMEHLPYMEGLAILAAERLLFRLWMHVDAPLPAGIFINMHRAFSSLPDDPRDGCIRDMARCSTDCPTSFIGKPEPESLFTKAEVETDEVATYYGMASISHANMIQALVRDGIYTRMGITSECELFATIYCDSVHPNVTGRLLLSDLLVNYLASAEEYFVAQAAAPGHSHSLEGRLLPLEPLDPQSIIVPRMRCFYGAADVSGNSAAAALSTMKVAKTDGWSFVEREGEAQKYKPGWVATEPGSVLWIELPLEFPAAAVQGETAPLIPAEPGSTIFVILSYLRSYQHMGKAEVTCLEGCSCKPRELDGHEPHIHHSIAYMLWVDGTVAAPGRCIVSVRVLPESSTQEHKIKVIQVAMGAQMNMTQQIRDLARTHVRH